MAGMVLRKSAIDMGVWSAPGTGPQVRDQFVQLDCALSHLDPDKDLARWRSYEQIKLARHRMMFLSSGFQGDVIPEPPTLEDQAGGGGKLADIFPEDATGFRRGNSIRGDVLPGVRVPRQQFALHLAVRVELEKILVYSAVKEFVFPRGQRRADPKSGMEFRL
jgi:hypothetical protein